MLINISLFRSESLKESKTIQTRSTSLVKFLNKISLSFDIIILPTAKFEQSISRYGQRNFMQYLKILIIVEYTERICKFSSKMFVD